MVASTRHPTRYLTVLAQDPSVQLKGKAVTVRVPVPAGALAPGPKGHRIHVIDFDATRNLYFPPRPGSGVEDDYASETDPEKLVADRHFHAQNAYALVAATLLHFEAALGRYLAWAFPSGSHHLKVAPHAFAEPNAYYSRRDEGVAFGYLPMDVGRKRRPSLMDRMVFTCLSADIVIHETTHAILDGLRSDYMRASTLDQPAFHEAFADIVALLSALSHKELITLVLPKGPPGRWDLVSRKDLKVKPLRHNVLIGLGEQFGKALAQQKLIAVRGDALRTSAALDPKEFNYGRMIAAGAEAHHLGEVLVAATLNAFLHVWEARAQKGLDPTGSGLVDRDRAAEEGAKAAEHLLRIVIRAIDYMPPINISFPDFLSAMLTADHEAVPDQGQHNYRGVLKQSFATFGIHPAGGTDPDGLWNRGASRQKREPLYGFSGHVEMTWDREAVMRFIWENRKVLEVDADAFTKVASVRPAVRVAPDGFVLRETVVEYFQLLDLTARDLKGLKLRKPDTMPDSTPVRLLGGGTMIFDDYGRLKFHIGTGVRSRRQNDRLGSMWAQGQTGRDLGVRRRFEQMHRMRALEGSERPPSGW